MIRPLMLAIFWFGITDALTVGLVPPSSRTRLPSGQGCYTVTNRSECCAYTDGRTDVAYQNQECVPARGGSYFEDEYRVVCEPMCWVDGSCSASGASAWGKAVFCGGSRTPVAGGCYTIADRKQCCLGTDGREDPAYNGQECVPSLPGISFDDMHDTVCEPSCWVDGTCGETGGRVSMASGCISATRQHEEANLPTKAPISKGTIEQDGARVPVGGRLRFYVVGSSNGAWQTWPDQLHAMLQGMGYNVDLPSTSIPGEIVRPSKSPKCANKAAYEELKTPRLGMVGWSSWGFAFNDTSDCDAEGYRIIASTNVSCTNAWACNPLWTGSVPFVPVTGLAEGVQGADVVILSNWINDGKTAMNRAARKVCYRGANMRALDTVDITASNLKNVIRSIHALNPRVTIIVLARYVDTRMTVFPNERTLGDVAAMNKAVKMRIQEEPNTFFLDLEFPLKQNIFQTLSKFHPNCRGDKVMATDIINKLFELKVISKGLALGDIGSCLGASACAQLDVACCQRSALCYMLNGTCADYGPGSQ